MDLRDKLGTVIDRRVGTVVAGRHLHDTLVGVGSTDPRRFGLTACAVVHILDLAGISGMTTLKSL